MRIPLRAGDDSVLDTLDGAGTPLTFGAARGIRTPDPIITNDVLYRLSYCGVLRRAPDIGCHGALQGSADPAGEAARGGTFHSAVTRRAAHPLLPSTTRRSRLEQLPDPTPALALGPTASGAGRPGLGIGAGIVGRVHQRDHRRGNRERRQAAARRGCRKLGAFPLCVCGKRRTPGPPDRLQVPPRPPRIAGSGCGRRPVLRSRSERGFARGLPVAGSIGGASSAASITRRAAARPPAAPSTRTRRAAR